MILPGTRRVNCMRYGCKEEMKLDSLVFNVGSEQGQGNICRGDGFCANAVMSSDDDCYPADEVGIVTVNPKLSRQNAFHHLPSSVSKISSEDATYRSDIKLSTSIEIELLY